MPRAQSVEGFGFVYLEASSHGLAVLAHRIGGVEDAIKDGKTGILTNLEKPEELENALKEPSEVKMLDIAMRKLTEISPEIGKLTELKCLDFFEETSETSGKNNCCWLWSNGCRSTCQQICTSF